MSKKEISFDSPKYKGVGKNKKLLNYIQGSLDDCYKMKNMAIQHIESFNYAMGTILKILFSKMHNINRQFRIRKTRT